MVTIHTYKMRFFRSAKPKMVNSQQLALKLQPSDLLYVCRTRVLDKTILLRDGKKYDDDFFNYLEGDNPKYFIVTKHLEYCVITSFLFQNWLMYTPGPLADNAEIFSNERPTKAVPGAVKCFEHYIAHIEKN